MEREGRDGLRVKVGGDEFAALEFVCADGAGLAADGRDVSGALEEICAAWGGAVDGGGGESGVDCVDYGAVVSPAAPAGVFREFCGRALCDRGCACGGWSCSL